MISLSDDRQADIIESFDQLLCFLLPFFFSRYLDDLLNIVNPYFKGLVSQIYPTELQLNKTNSTDTEAAFLDLHLLISNGFYVLGGVALMS